MHDLGAMQNGNKAKPIFHTNQSSVSFFGGDFSPICASCVGEEYLKCFLAIALQCSQQTLGSSTAQHYVLILGAVEVQVDFFLSTS